jgi:hypothetical protein
MKIGHIPADMDDKWFIFFEDGWLYFHRSWTGDCIYGLRLDGCPGGVRVIDCWASRAPDRYNSPGVEKEKEMIQRIIAHKFLA